MAGPDLAIDSARVGKLPLTAGVDVEEDAVLPAIAALSLAGFGGAPLAVPAENPRLQKLRSGIGTYGWCAWCDAAVCSPTGLWNHSKCLADAVGQRDGSKVSAFYITRKGIEVLGDAHGGMANRHRSNLPDGARLLGGLERAELD